MQITQGCTVKHEDTVLVKIEWLASSLVDGHSESAFASYVGFGVLMTSKLETNEIYCNFSPLKVLKKLI